MAMPATAKRRLPLQTILGRTGLYILLLAITCVCMLPLFWLLRSSLMSNGEIFIAPPRLLPSRFRWENYGKAFAAFDALKYGKNTMSILIPCVIGTVLTSAMCGYGFARIDFPGKKFWFMLVIGAMILPGHVVLIPQFIMWSRLGAINTFWPLTLGAFLGGGAGNIFLMRQFFRTLPREYDEAAIIDGCGYTQIFFRILMPLIRPIMITIAIFTFMGVWNDFQGPLLYLQREEKFTLALGLLTFRGSYSSKWNLLMAASAAMIVPAILLFAVGQKYFLEGITLTGIKG